MKLFRVVLVVAAGSLGVLMGRYVDDQDQAGPLQRQVEAELRALREHLFG
ncbi:MAG: hypothetical protein ACREQE_11665 [Candidatus Binataceae bacterium]